MSMSRPSLVVVLIAATLLAGCQPGLETVTEYRPRVATLNERLTSQEGVVELVRWTPVTPSQPTTRPGEASAKPVEQIPLTVERVYMLTGQTVGFRRSDGQLLAVAGISAHPLNEGHYEWRTASRPGYAQRMGKRIGAAFGHVAEGAAVTGIVVAVVTVVGGLVYLSLRYGDHCNCDNNSPAGN